VYLGLRQSVYSRTVFLCGRIYHGLRVMRKPGKMNPVFLRIQRLGMPIMSPPPLFWGCVLSAFAVVHLDCLVFACGDTPFARVVKVNARYPRAMFTREPFRRLKGPQ
jgi:hypothetical protein